MKIVIIGNGPAAVKALEAISMHQAASEASGAEITVISAEKVASYSPMFLADYLTGDLAEAEILAGEEYTIIPERLLGEKVINVENSGKRVITESGKEIGYDRLLIASGASPIKPAIEGIDKEGVHFFNRLEDVKRLSEQVAKVKKVIIIGAGVIGIEVAVALNNIGLDVVIVELLGQILPQVLEEDLAGHVERKLSSSGIKFVLREGVSEITGDSRVAGVIAGDKEIPADLVLVAAGVNPNIDFLRSSSIRVNQGILVNEKMQTNVPDIYAAGDVAESIDPYGGYELVFNWYNAVDQGWTAGCNIAGVKNICGASPSLVALKGLEPPVISIGRKYAENGYEILSGASEKKGVYEKVIIKSDYIDCYQAIGASDKAGLIYGYVRERRDIGNVKGMLFDKYSPISLMV